MPRNPRNSQSIGDSRLLPRAASVGVRLVLLLLLVVGDTGRLGAAASRTSASTELATPGIAELSIDTGQMDHLGDTTRYKYVILQEYMYDHVAAIKRANPKTMVLAYLDAATAHRRSCTGTAQRPYAPHDSFGVNFCYAASQHPEWFLHNSAGARLAYANYPSYMAMDIGNPAYQSTWAKNVIAAVKADGFDGVYMDDVNTYPGHGINGKIAEYTDRAYGLAMASFIATVSADIRSAGLVVGANVAANPWIDWQRADGLDIASHLTAYAREHYSRYGDICGPFSNRFNTTATNGTPPLVEMLNYDMAVQAAGADLLGVDYGYSPATASDLATMAYGRAAFLLAWDGSAGGAYMYRPCGDVDPASAAWTLELGTPAATAVLTGAVYQRSYSRGVVFLNPSPDRTVTVSVPDGYVDAHGARVSGSVEVAPVTALVLRRPH